MMTTAGATKTKYAFLVGDGMSDRPLPELGGKTPLDHANTPNMDAIARTGSTGLVQTIPEGLPPGSDVGNLALLGYAPARYFSGRAPIEAVAMGVHLEPKDIAFRCNLVTLEDGCMSDYAGGHFTDDEAAELIAWLQKTFDRPGRSFHRGVDYRHLCVLSGLDAAGIETTPPHDISGKPSREYLPRGKAADPVIALMAQAHDVLAACPVNQRRASEGKPRATDIWLWGQGKALSLPTLHEQFGLSGSVISAVNLVNGLGVLAGLERISVPGATGYLGTNYAGKVEAARTALEKGDFVFLHVEAPDETSHEGSIEKKIQAIEEFDQNVVGPMRALQQQWPELRIMVSPDHATPISLKTHSSDPVPFCVCGPGIAASGAEAYCERIAASGKTYSGETMFRELIRGTFA
jgi:2,3-bisphosphoglycerate-independent phosphoglycerate mutase